MPDSELNLSPQATALVLIDLQRSIAGRDHLAPHDSSTVVNNAAKLADRFRRIGSLVVLVHVNFGHDGKLRLTAPVDEPSQGGATEPGWDEIVPEIGPKTGDLVVTKHQWGAFYGTYLDVQLRRRGIGTIVLGGIATNMGVESTARDAYEHGYALVIVEDATTSMSADLHEFAVKRIFPKISRVRATRQVLDELSGR